MEIIKTYANYVNPHWIAVVATGMYTHLRDICVIGLCFGVEKEPPFDTSYASVLFTFSVLCLLAEYRLWPRTLKDPPFHLLYIYEMLVAALTTNLAKHLIWIPLMHGLYCLTQESSKLLISINEALGLEHDYLITFAYYIEVKGATHMALCMSVLSFVWMLDATEALDTVIDTWANDLEEEDSAVPCRCDRRISFSNPEVSSWYIYRFACPRHQPNAARR